MVVEGKDALLHDNNARILHLKGNVLDKYEKLKKTHNHTVEQSAKAAKL